MSPLSFSWLRLASLCWLIFGLSSLATAQTPPPIPEVYRPDDSLPLPAGVLKALGRTEFLHLGVGPSQFSASNPIFSPDGGTICVPGNSSFIAFDIATGKIRYHYRYSGWNVEIRNAAPAGIRVHFQQGPLAGQVAVVDYATGKEVSRSAGTAPPNSQFLSEFLQGQRRLLTQDRPKDPRRGGPNSPMTVLYDVQNQKVLKQLGPLDHRHAAVLSSDERWLAVSLANKVLSVCDTITGDVKHELKLHPQENTGHQMFPCWSPDNRTIYIWRCFPDKAELIALDVTNGETKVLYHDKRTMVRSSVVASPDGKLIAFQENDNPWELTPFWKVMRLADQTVTHVVDPRPAVTFATFSPDSQSLWLAGPNGMARYDLARSEFDRRSADPLSITQAISFSADGRRLVSVSGTELITWDVETGEEVAPRTGFEAFCRERAHMRCLSVSPDGQRTVWAGRHAEEQIHALEQGKKVASFYASNMNRQQEFDITVDQQTIVHDSYFGALKVADLWTGKVRQELLPQANPRETYKFALAPDNRTLAVVHRPYQQFSQQGDITIELWDWQQGKRFGELKQTGDGQMSMQFSQDGGELRIHNKGMTSVWDIRSRSVVRQRRDNTPHQSFGFTPNRHWQLKYSFLGNGIRQVELVDVHTGRIARTWEHPLGHIQAYAFSPGNRRLAFASVGSPILLYDFYEIRPDTTDWPALTDDAVAAHLAGTDVRMAFSALCELIRRGDKCLPALQARLSRSPASRPQVAEWISQLDSPDFARRETATRQLQAFAEDIAPLLREELAEGGSQEKQARLKRILARFTEGDVARDRLLAYRVCEVLEALRTPAARALLEELSRGDARHPATSEAQATLARVL